jgi:FMN phosphatase YigB (HAD superfamily)
MDLPASEIAYVGDRVDNDVRPAAAAGMRAIFIRRGPWAWIQAPRDDPPEATLTIATLAELPAALAALETMR